MKKIALKDLIYRNYLKTSLTSLVLIEIFLIVLYFSVNNNLSKKNIDFMINDISTDINKYLDLRYDSVSKDFQSIEQNLKIVKRHHEDFFKNYDDIPIKNDIKLAKAKNQITYKQTKKGSSVAVSNRFDLTEDIRKKILKTEKFDLLYESIVKNNDNIVAAYFNSYDNINRYYPYIDNVYDVFTPSFDVKKFNFYNKANLQNNPSKKVVWTSVYLDPVSKKWIVSAIAPIYNDGFLEGVVGLDMKVNNMINQFLKINLPYEASSFILCDKGKVVAMPNSLRKVFKINELASQNELKKIDKTVYPPGEYDIFHQINQKQVDKFKRILKDEPYSNSLLIDDKEYFVFSKKLEKTPWYVVSLVPKYKLFKSLNELKTHYENLGYLVIGTITIFYLIFFVFLYYKAKGLVDSIKKPIFTIIDKTKFIGSNKDIQKLEENNIYELNELNKNFNEMAQKLNQRTKKLVDSETKRVLIERDSKIDALTKTYNRKYLDEYSKEYIYSIKENNFTMSLLLIDLDDFKQINDKYGHDAGDEVIVKFIEYTKSVTREDDAIVRYGGDEFLIILSNTIIKDAKVVANKIINAINKKNDTKYKFSVSIGCAQSKSEDKNLQDVIKRADNSLYEAKKRGKAQII
ncbi:MAG: diguanylate cyclase [Campylobacterota bacterium]